jgi:hypothetical protein
LELEPAKVLYHLDPMNVGLCLHGYSAFYIWDNCYEVGGFSVTIAEFGTVLQLGAKRPAAGLPKVVDKKAKTETPNKPGHPCFPYFCLHMVKVSFENKFMLQR